MDVTQSGDGKGSDSKSPSEYGSSTQTKIIPPLGNQEGTQNRGRSINFFPPTETRDTSSTNQLSGTTITTLAPHMDEGGTLGTAGFTPGDIPGSSLLTPEDTINAAVTHQASRKTTSTVPPQEIQVRTTVSTRGKNNCSSDLPGQDTDDTVDGRYEVEYDTESVVSGFMCHLYQHVHSRQQYDDAPYAADFENLNRRDSLSADIGRRLAHIGDDIYERHGREMDYLLRRLNPNKDNVFKVFSTIASKTISDGISWGRILVLLCFGFRMLTQALSFGLPQGSLRTLVSSIVQVFILKKITDWISRNGGWAASLSFNPSASNLAMAFVIGAGVGSAIAAVYKKLS